MRTILSRRMFLAVTGGALAAPFISYAVSEVPELLDHMILGCNDLDRGIAFVEDRTGVRAAFGGVHPGRGTRNALLSLGERRYLEIIAPDPDQPDAKEPLALHLRKLSEPQITGWAVHPGDLGSFAKKLRDAGVAFEGPTPGSRKRPDGRVVQWHLLTLKDNPSWLLPFFIEWSGDSVHPSVDAPSGCRLVRFGVVSPAPGELARTFHLLGVDVAVAHGENSQLRARIGSPKGEFEVTS
ncbi:MAG TPA: VOC family protein [Candidatus Acidoferrum sp.]|nr:VOC family protein [Candidatus Acidoferrum sp.]